MSRGLAQVFVGDRHLCRDKSCVRCRINVGADPLDSVNSSIRESTSCVFKHPITKRAGVQKDSLVIIGCMKLGIGPGLS